MTTEDIVDEAYQPDLARSCLCVSFDVDYVIREQQALQTHEEISYLELPPARGSRNVGASRELWRDLSSLDPLLWNICGIFGPPHGTPDRTLGDSRLAGSVVVYAEAALS